MRVITAALVCVLGLVFVTGDAEAQRRRGRWNNTGWVKLGERQVNGRVDRDTITVGRYEGRFSKLTMVVEDNDLELLDFVVTFAGGQQWSPRLQFYFREGTSTRVIDLPGDDRVIQRIDLRYRNVGGGRGATVEIWGLKTDGGGRGPGGPGPGRFSWNSSGWEMLGERVVNGRVDRDTIRVGRYKGRFSQLTLVVQDSDLELLDFEIRFQRGPSWRPNVQHYFRENQRTRVIDLPESFRGGGQVIQQINLRYRNVPGGGRAKVQVWGR